MTFANRIRQPGGGPRWRGQAFVWRRERCNSPVRLSIYGWYWKQGMDRKNAADVEIVRVEKSYEALADQLRERILDGSIPTGTLLPNEMRLCEQSGLSRGSVREALRILEAQGLVATRMGRNGGRVAQRTSFSEISQSLAHFVRGQRIEFTALMETAEALEPALAGLAAIHRNDQDIEAIGRATQELCDAADDPRQFELANAEWHLAVAFASHNPVLIAMMQSVGSLLHDPHVENFTSASVREAVIKAHDRVQIAILDGDADAARRRMERHVKAYKARVVPLAPKTITLS